MLSVVFAAGFSGALVSVLGYYWPWLVAGPLLIMVGAGLLYTVKETSSSAILIGYQIVSLESAVRTKQPLTPILFQLLGVGGEFTRAFDM